MAVTRLTLDEARRIGEEIGIDWRSAPFDVDELRAGIEAELEHGVRDVSTRRTHEEALASARAAWTHLQRFPDHYHRAHRELRR